MSRKLTNVRRKRHKWQLYTQVRGHTCSEMRATCPGAAEVTEWLHAQQLKFGGVGPSVPGSLSALRDLYLRQVQSKPTADQIAAHLQLWIDALGRDRKPQSLTPTELNIIMDEWKRTPTNQPDPTIPGRRGRPSAATGVSPSTVKKRRATFRRMFNVLNGKHGFNPVRGSDCPDVPDAEDARGIPVADALAIIAAMPAERYVKKGIHLPALAPVRALVFLWTGLPPHLIEQIKPGDLHLDAPVPKVRASRRRKGKGVEARDIELCPQAVAAFRAFVAANAFGHFESGPFNVSVKRAAARAGVSLPADFHAYDLRHTFGAALADSGADEATIARLMMHAKHSTVGRRYTQAAHKAINAKAVAALGQAHPVPAPVHDPVHQSARKSARLRKTRVRKHLRIA